MYVRLSGTNKNIPCIIYSKSERRLSQNMLSLFILSLNVLFVLGRVLMYHELG